METYLCKLCKLPQYLSDGDRLHDLIVLNCSTCNGKGLRSTSWRKQGFLVLEEFFIYNTVITVDMVTKSTTVTDANTGEEVEFDFMVDVTNPALKDNIKLWQAFL